MIYRFEFGKRDSILLGAGALLLGVVLFFAGFFTDRLIARQPLPRKAAAVAPSSTKEAAAATPAVNGGPVPKSQESPAPAALHEPAVNGAAGPAANLQLAVQVGVFAEIAKAKSMAEQLQKEGFSPVITSQAGRENQQISVVEIGPFSAWEDASRVAQVIGRSLGIRPAIRPML